MKGLRRLVPAPVKRRLRAAIGRVAGKAAAFPDVAFHPFRPGEDYALPWGTGAEDSRGDMGFPTPPPHLWVEGYDSGAEHVSTMLGIARESGFDPGAGGAILDLGCGAGRMIRHLAPNAGRCEIWGADIRAEAIFWCQAHLSPPFNFVTTTRVPQLPFADGYFRFVYCASLFTHIDDLAMAWLLELNRVLAADGRLYLTIHDERTIALFDRPHLAARPGISGIKARPAFAGARDGFAMISIGRDDRSQVFYARDHFARMAGAAFDLVSITPEALAYQTAFLLRPRMRGTAPD